MTGPRSRQRPIDAPGGSAATRGVGIGHRGDHVRRMRLARHDANHLSLNAVCHRDRKPSAKGANRSRITDPIVLGIFFSFQARCEHANFRTREARRDLAGRSIFFLGRAYFLIRKSEQDDLQDLIAPALKGLSRSGATVLLITVIPGGFLRHLSTGIVTSLAHGYVWDKGHENKEAILTVMKSCLANLQGCDGQHQLI
jgi:hypothetical protein